MSYLAYSEYKPSGVEWLGSIPKHWEAVRFKFLKREPFVYGVNEAAELDDPGLPRFVRITDLNDDGTLRSDTFKSLPEAIAAPYLLKEGDFLLARSGAAVGKAFMYSTSWGRACFAGYLIRFRPDENKIDRNYLRYYLQSSVYAGFVKESTIQATIQNVSAERYGNFTVPLPQLLDEQRSIALHLDKITERADAIIRVKTAQLDTLAELRRTLVTQIVTRGLDPDIPRKSTRVPWLHDIPEHWDTKRLKFVSLSLQTGPFGSQLHAEDYVQGEVPVVNPANIVGGRLIANPSVTIDEETVKRLKRHILHVGDIVFGRRGEMARCGLVTEAEAGWLCGTGSLRIRPNQEQIDPAYLNLALSLEGVKDWLKLESIGSTMDNLNTEILANLPIPFPPTLDEQRNIVTFLDRELEQMTAIQQTIEEQIEALRHYRQSLITAAVTGRIDVRGLAA